jgi:predicted  nucleic acid-binding Zn-ribbon protein
MNQPQMPEMNVACADCGHSFGAHVLSEVDNRGRVGCLVCRCRVFAYVVLADA